MKKILFFTALITVFVSCTQEKNITTTSNPVLVNSNQPIRFDEITAEDIRAAYDSATSAVAPAINAIMEVEEGQRTFENTMVALDNLYDNLSTPYGIVYLMGSTHPDSAIRETAIAVRTDFAKLFNELQLNENLYKAVKAYSQTTEAQNLQGYKRKFLEETVTEFERNGFALSLEEREQLKEILNEISTIGNEFNTNIAAYEDFLILSEEDMAGLSEEYKKSHLQEDGTYKVGLSYPDFVPFMNNAESADARKKLYMKYTNRAADKNLEVLDRMLAKRAELAKLLGYETFAHYQVEPRMAKTPQTVWDFEEKLTESVRPKGEEDYAELVNFKKNKLKDNSPINSWDKNYLVEELKSTNYGVDEEVVKEYFPIENVKEGLFAITQKLFGVTYQKMEHAYTWHPDVDGYDVYDGAKIIGRFYLDLHPRPNKYSHAACFPIKSSKQKDDFYQIPVASLVCNFSEPTEDKPALMRHSEVETFFHEFGHVLHNMLSRTTLGSQSGTSVARDFVEAPSQIFENWAWDYESLKLFAKHYETGAELPKELFDKMLAAKNVMSGINVQQQIFYGSYDMTLHNRFNPASDRTTTDVLKDLQSNITMFDYVPGTHFQAAFGHLNGYAASYYGYLWSEVYAQDMFSRFKKEGILSPEVGDDYRRMILERGSEVDEMSMLKEFLGREPNDSAYVKSIGL